MNWYYATGGQQQGPVEDAQFEALIQSGQITPETLVWHDGMPNWQPLRQARPSAAATPSPAATPPPVIGASPAANEIVCVECGKTFTRDNAIQYGTTWVCATCKPVFLQKLREGAPISSNAEGVMIGEQEILAREYRIDIGECLNRGWKVFTNNTGLIIGTSLVVALAAVGLWLVAMAVGLLIPFGNMFVQTLFTGPLAGGYLWFHLKLARGQPTGLGDAFAGFSPFNMQLMLASLVQGVMSVVCMLPAGIVAGMMGFNMASNQSPGSAGVAWIAVVAVLGAASFAAMVYLSTIWTYSLLLIIDKGYKFWPAMQLSRRLVSIRWWMTFLFLFVAGIVMGAGIMACLVGALVTVPLYFSMRAFLYDDNFRNLRPGQD